METSVVIGSRESNLAMIQSEIVRKWIEENHPEMKAEIHSMKTTGDKILDKSLDKIGGKGLFVKELDRALMDGRTDISVHSLKDMPMEIPEELPLIGYSKREDPRDVLVLPAGVTEFDIQKPVGCSSKRRMLQFQQLYPEATFKMIRGNVLTRLEKLDAGEYGAIILAAAGLKRLGLEHRISRYFSPKEMLPSAGQGILAVQGKAGCDYSYFEGFSDKDSELAARAERSFVCTLNGGCSSPIAAYAEVMYNQIFLTGLFYDDETGKWKKGTLAGSKDTPEQLGEELAKKLKRQLLEEEPVEPGKVFLVGAGPGDAGLLTIKGKELISRADVIVYDSLVGDSILSMLPNQAKKINVGKRAGKHIRSQYEINNILLEEAEAGNMVVRLKGGDPFLFGRGGEELELLYANHIPYEVVPGVTSSLAVPAYNGIPVTHRDYCSSLHIITGHKRVGVPLSHDFEALVRTKGTLVFLMGLNALEYICKGLMEAGMEKDMPAAVLQSGTTARQRRVIATVSTLKEEVEKAKIVTPAIIVVGKVCQLANEFGWYEKLPLSGKKIAVTRPRDLISEMAKKLRILGAEVLELPTISTQSMKETESFQQAIEELSKYQWLVFTSPTGVRVFFDAMKDAGKDMRALGHLKIASIGKGSSRELEARGLFADLIPEVYDGAHLGRALAKNCENGAKILIPRAEIGNKEILEELAKREDLLVTDVATYHTCYEDHSVLNQKELFESGQMDYAVFTSASTVRGFAAVTEGLDYSKVTAVCIGKQTAAEAERYGMKCYVSKEATMDSMIDLILQL